MGTAMGTALRPPLVFGPRPAVKPARPRRGFVGSTAGRAAPSGPCVEGAGLPGAVELRAYRARGEERPARCGAASFVLRAACFSFFLLFFLSVPCFLSFGRFVFAVR